MGGKKISMKLRQCALQTDTGEEKQKRLEMKIIEKQLKDSGRKKRSLLNKKIDQL